MTGSAIVFDHGGRRIGVAIANRSPHLASPLLTLAARDGVPDWPAVDKLLAEWRPDELVVGIPYNGAAARVAGAGNPTGADSETAAGHFADELGTRYGLPVTRIDERLTSVEAEARLREQRRSGHRRKRVRSGDVDALAACVIAEMWLNQA